MKVRTLVAAAVVAAAPVLLPATAAFAATSDTPCCAQQHCTPCPPPCPPPCVNPCWGGSPWDTVPNLATEQAIFNQGGADLGRGAGELVSSAVLGGEEAILDAPSELLGVPKPINYVWVP
jgi:hypothetical protein